MGALSHGHVVHCTARGARSISQALSVDHWRPLAGGAILAAMSSAADRAASEVNRELTGLLADAGRRFGFEVVLEYPVRGGRLDVVWTWAPPTRFPGLDTPVPVVGFEIESSWRTRKHVKGDLLNLHDAGVGLGVIVLAGTDPKDDGLRRFAELLVDRPGPTTLVWTAEDVRVLETQHDVAAGIAGVPRAAAGTAPGPSANPTAPLATGPATVRPHAGKYAPLYRWLRAQDVTTLTLTFGDVEEVLGFPLPNSCRQHVPHWHSYDGSAVARAIVDAGWKASRVHLTTEELTLVRTAQGR